MSLKKKRERWEKGGEEVLAVTKVEDGAYSTVYVILNFNGEYSLHRYFPSYRPDGKVWEVSVDVSNSTLESCLSEVSSAFEDCYAEAIKFENYLDTY